MPNKRITQLNYNNNLSPDDRLAIVNSGETKQISYSGLTGPFVYNAIYDEANGTATLFKYNGEFIELTGFTTTTTIDDKILLKSNVPTGYISGLSMFASPFDNTKFSITNGYYVITEYIEPYTVTPHLIFYSGANEVTDPYLGSTNVTYVALDINQNLLFSTNKFDNVERRSVCILGALVHPNNTIIEDVNEFKAPIVAVQNQLHDFILAIGPLNLSGNIYSPNGDSLMLNKTEGVIWDLGINALVIVNNPHELTIDGQSGLTFNYRLFDGFDYPLTTDVDPNNYEFNGVLTAVTTDKFTIQHINLFQSSDCVIQYGQHEYDTLADAENFIVTEDFLVEPNIAENGFFRSYLIVKQGCTALTNTNEAKFISVDKFGNTVNGGLTLTSELILDALGFTPENVALKQNAVTIDDNNQYYSVTGVNSGLSNRVSKFGDIMTGSLSATSFVKSGGASSQFLKADGSSDSTTYQSQLVSGTNIKTIGGNSIVGSGDVPVNLLDQIEVGSNTTVSESWKGKVIIFNTSCTITIPSVLSANFSFVGQTLQGVTITWVITAPKTWLFGAPAPTSEKTNFWLGQRGSTDSLILNQ